MLDTSSSLPVSPGDASPGFATALFRALCAGLILGPPTTLASCRDTDAERTRATGRNGQRSQFDVDARTGDLACDLGRNRRGSRLEFRHEFLPTDPVRHISEIRATCGCVAARVVRPDGLKLGIPSRIPFELTPGTVLEGWLTVTADGPIAQRIEFVPTPTSSGFVVNLHATGYTPLVVQPTTLFLGDVDPGATAAGTLHVSHSDGTPVGPLACEFPDRSRRPRMIFQEARPDGTVGVRCQFDVGTSPGPVSTRVTVRDARGDVAAAEMIAVVPDPIRLPKGSSISLGSFDARRGCTGSLILSSASDITAVVEASMLFSGRAELGCRIVDATGRPTQTLLLTVTEAAPGPIHGLIKVRIVKPVQRTMRFQFRGVAR